MPTNITCWQHWQLLGFQQRLQLLLLHSQIPGAACYPCMVKVVKVQDDHTHRWSLLLLLLLLPMLLIAGLVWCGVVSKNTRLTPGWEFRHTVLHFAL
jgi:hypothetical protein